MNQRYLLTPAFLLASMLPAHAQTIAPEGRAMWFWQSPQSPFGSAAIIGHTDREDAAIAHLKSWRVTTLYGSYPASTDPAALRAWNAKLTAHGIRSFLLMSETEYLNPAKYPALATHIAKNFTDFNMHAEASERFAGLAFDIEPHILPAWKTEAPLSRRADLDLLLHLYQYVRTLIGSAQLEATLPTWFSHVNGSIAWNNSLDRDRYFAALATACDRLSIMAFEQPSGDKSLDRSREEAELLHGRARIALRANLGHEWSNLAAFWQAAEEVERLTHTPIEIQDFAILAADEDTTKRPAPHSKTADPQ